MVDKPAYRCYACFSFTAIVKKDEMVSNNCD